MRALSLFSGIGGFDLGLERAGMTIAAQVEIDPYARRVLAKHWPDVPRFEDVREVGRDQLPQVDLVAGGFPCQDISVAGNRAGIDGPRSGLWSEFARIVREVRPRYVLVENVPALRVRGLGRVLGDLAASGYDAEWDCLPAIAFGAHHRRDRLFLVAYANGYGLRPQQKQQPGCSASEIPDAHGPSRRLADANGQRQLQQGRSLEVFRGWSVDSRSENRGTWAPEPGVGRVADGIPHRVDRLRGLGNAVVPQIAEWIGRRILTADA